MILTINKITTGTVAVLMLILTSCAGLKNAQLNTLLEKSNCNQQNVYSYSTSELPKPIHELDIDTALTSRFSFKSLNVANAIGILDMLSSYVNLLLEKKQNPTLENRLALIELTQQINQKINTSSLEISAIASEMDCEEERTSQIANFLKAKEDEAETRLTVGAIIIGASGALARGILLNNEHSSDYIEIGAGIAEATLGLLILTNKRKIE
ncbi:MAG TPA: hypothetical protein VIK89_04775, partial [Cytophagaceae bacterium]